MKRKAVTDYRVKVNGMPDYEKIPKSVLEAIAKKFLENILKQKSARSEE